MLQIRTFITYKKSSYALIKRVAMLQCGTLLKIRSFTTYKKSSYAPMKRAAMLQYGTSLQYRTSLRIRIFLAD